MLATVAANTMMFREAWKYASSPTAWIELASCSKPQEYWTEVEWFRESTYSCRGRPM
jgi:hypothetical protein